MEEGLGLIWSRLAPSVCELHALVCCQLGCKEECALFGCCNTRFGEIRGERFAIPRLLGFSWGLVPHMQALGLGRSDWSRITASYTYPEQ